MAKKKSEHVTNVRDRTKAVTLWDFAAKKNEQKENQGSMIAMT